MLTTCIVLFKFVRAYAYLMIYVIKVTKIFIRWLLGMSVSESPRTVHCVSLSGKVVICRTDPSSFNALVLTLSTHARFKGIIRASKLKRIDFICHFSNSLYPDDFNDMHS